MLKKAILGVCTIIFFICAQVPAATLYWSADGLNEGGSGTWDTTTGHWGTAATGPFTNVWNNANSDSAIFENGATTNTVSAGITMKGTMTINSPVTLNGTSTITYNSGSTISVASGVGFTNNNPYAGTITKAGSGTVSFNNANGNVTKFNFNAGVSAFASPNRFGVGSDTPGFLTLSGGTMSVNTTTGFFLGHSVALGTASTLTGSSSTITVTADHPVTSVGSGTLTVSTVSLTLWSAANTFTNLLNITGGTLTCDNNHVIPDGNSVTLAGGSMNVGSAGTNQVLKTLIVNSSSSAISGAGTLTITNLLDLRASGAIAPVINGSGRATKTGTGTVTLNGANTYTGGTIHSNGTIILGASGQFGSGTLQLSGGALMQSANRTAANTLLCPVVMNANTTIQNTNTGAGYVQMRAGGLWTVTAGTLTIKNPTSAAGGQFDLLLTNGTTWAQPIVVGLGGDTGGSQLTFDNASTSPDHVFSEVISGTGSIRKTSTGRVILLGDNTYSGGVSNNAGYIALGLDSTGSPGAPASGPLGTGTIYVAGGGFQAYGNARTVHNNSVLTGNLNIGGTNDLTFTGTFTLGTNARTITVTNGVTSIQGNVSSDVLSGALALTKAGTGTIAFSADNTIAGNTTISAGTVQDATPSGAALGMGNINIATAGTLAGTINTTGMLTNAGTLAPGNGVGTITTADQYWTNGAKLKYDLVDAAGANDQVVINGALNFTATTNKAITIDVGSLGAAIANFDNTSAYNWPIISTTTGITGFDSNKIAVITTNIASPLGNGGFGVQVDGTGNTLLLRFIQIPTISINPTSKTITLNGSATFTVSASGPELGYQWYHDGVLIPGANSSSYSISGAQATDAGIYTVTVSNVGGGVTSTGVSLTISDAAPLITLQPASRSVGVGSNTTFSVIAVGPSLVYQWRIDKGSGPVALVDGTVDVISGSTTTNLTIGPVAHADEGTYTVLVNNGNGPVTSSNATLSAYDAPVISAQPGSMNTTASNNVVFNVALSQGTTPSFQWKKNGAVIADGTKYNGTTTASLTVGTAVIGDQGSFTVVITNVAGSITSSNGVLSVSQGPTITIQPSNQLAAVGGNVTFSATATGSPTLAYQWFLNGSPISGATAASYPIVGAQKGNVGLYSVVVANSAGSTTSSEASLTLTGMAAFADPLDSDTSANWQVNTAGNVNNRRAWGFDYSTLGVPQAPGSSSTKALKLECNVSGTAAISAQSLSPIGQNFTGDYQLRFYAWQNAVGPFPVGGTGSTEGVTAGIGTTGSVVEWAETGSSADGVWAEMNGDGQAAETYRYPDYGIFIGPTLQSSNTGVYASGTGGTALDCANAYYTAKWPARSAPAAQTAMFGTQTENEAAGSFGFAWHEVILRNSGGVVTWLIDGFAIASITNASFAGNNVSVGYLDPFSGFALTNASTTSYATNVQYGLISNVRVEMLSSNGFAPSISGQPQSATANAGDPASFSVTASGTGTLKYQWQHNGSSVAGATDSTFNMGATSQVDGGSYHVLVFNDSAVVKSDDVTLTVIGGTPPPAPVLALPTGAGSSSVTLLWSSVAGTTYTPQFTGNLIGWTNLPNVTATGSTATAIDNPNGDTNRFYRVLALP